MSLSGPDITLAPNQAASLGMVFYELATNAAKYGALSVPSGTVAVTWEIATLSQDAREVRLSWVERSGPPVNPPRVRGFGTDFVERSLSFELDGTAQLAFDPAGLRCAITFPLKRNTE